MAAARITIGKLQDLLTRRLRLRDPQFHLEKYGGRIVGNIISPSFRGKREHKRQELIWKVLKDELGQGFPTRVGMLLPYTPEEWHPAANGLSTSRAKRKDG